MRKKWTWEKVLATAWSSFRSGEVKFIKKKWKIDRKKVVAEELKVKL